VDTDASEWVTILYNARRPDLQATNFQDLPGMLQRELAPLFLGSGASSRVL